MCLVEIEGGRFLQLHPVGEAHFRVVGGQAIDGSGERRQRTVGGREDDDVTGRLLEIDDAFVIDIASRLGGQEVH